MLEGFRRDKIRCVILRAPAGSKVWSAGHDIGELPRTGRDPLGWRCLRAGAGPIQTVDRMTPWVFLPYIILSP